MNLFLPQTTRFDNGLYGSCRYGFQSSLVGSSPTLSTLIPCANLDNASVNRARDTVVTGFHRSRDVGALLPQLLRQRRVEQRNALRNLFRLVTWHLFAAACTLDQAAFSFSAFSTPTTFSLKRHNTSHQSTASNVLIIDTAIY